MSFALVMASIFLGAFILFHALTPPESRGRRLSFQVSELVLDDDAVTEDGYAHMVARADAFRHLTRLHLPDVGAAARSKARLDAALVPVICWK